MKEVVVFDVAFKVGKRTRLAFNKKFNNIQLGYVGQPPVMGEANYEKECGLRIDKDEADAIISASEHLIDETKIVLESERKIAPASTSAENAVRKSITTN